MTEIDMKVVNFINRAFNVTEKVQLLNTAETVLEIAKMIQAQEIYEYKESK
jgi:hypothetical protein